MLATRALVRPTLGVSLPDAAPLEAFSLAELQEVVGRLSARCTVMLHRSNAEWSAWQARWQRISSVRRRRRRTGKAGRWCAAPGRQTCKGAGGLPAAAAGGVPPSRAGRPGSAQHPPQGPRMLRGDGRERFATARRPEGCRAASLTTRVQGFAAHSSDCWKFTTEVRQQQPDPPPQVCMPPSNAPEGPDPRLRVDLLLRQHYGCRH